MPGPFHRLELPTQTVADAKLRQSSNEIWGKPPTNTAQSSLPWLRPIGIAYRMVSVASISIPWSALRPEVGAPLMHGGILEPRAFYKELTFLEQFAPLSSCQDLLTGSHKPLDGAIR